MVVDSIKREQARADFAEKNQRRRQAKRECSNRAQRREAKWRRKIRGGAFMHEAKRHDWAYGTMGYFEGHIVNSRAKDEEE